MSTNRKALAERLEEMAAGYDAAGLTPVADLRAAASALREEGGLMAWTMYDNRTGHYYGLSWERPEFLNDAGHMIAIPLYRHPHTEDESE